MARLRLELFLSAWLHNCTLPEWNAAVQYDAFLSISPKAGLADLFIFFLLLFFSFHSCQSPSCAEERQYSSRLYHPLSCTIACLLAS